MADEHSVGLGKLLLVAAGVHLAGSAAVDDGDLLRPQPLGLAGDVDRRHAAADHHDAPADRELCEIVGLAQPGDIIDRIHDAGHVLPDAEIVHCAETDAQENGVVLPAQSGEPTCRPSRLPYSIAMPPTPSM